MKTDTLSLRPSALSAGITAILLAGAGSLAAADAIPYPNSGTPNPILYSFTASATGQIDAYFAGSSASYDNQLSMLVNGVPTGIVGLDDHTSSLGQELDLGNVNAGDTIVFELVNLSLGKDAFSDPTLNSSYDSPGDTLGHNHVYSTAYTANPVIGTAGVIPDGTYVAFEDLPFPGSDFNYHDETYVFTDVSTVATTPDTASTLGLFSIGLAGLGVLRRRFSR